MIKPLEWQWNKQSIKLTNLKDQQLYSIKQSILTNKKKSWFGTVNKVWLNEINTLLKQREKHNIHVIHYQIKTRRIKDAQLKANWVLRMFKNN